MQAFWDGEDVAVCLVLECCVEEARVAGDGDVADCKRGSLELVEVAVAPVEDWRA